MKSISQSDGFTLLELILSLAIVALMVGLSLGGIRLGIMARDAGDNKAETHQRLRTIAQQLGQKIKSNYPVYIQKKDQTFARDEANLQAAKRSLAFQGGENFVRLVTFSPPLTGDPEHAPFAHETLIYQGELPKTGETGIILMEREIQGDNLFTYIEPDQPDSRFYMLSKDVKYLKFRYYQMEKIPKNELESQSNPSITHRGLWVDEIFNVSARQLTEAEIERNKRLGIQGDDAISLPRAIEISIGLTEQPIGEEEAVVAYAPPIIIPLNSGMEFALPAREAEDAAN
ncbi:MAG: type II secretion system protein [Candidatus Nitrohelix vancouverensis]|uniref:Type II secretion system protein n=1 Tax=Candidatus Nitrohelix vancouverensis TaxID=2705534 RepID=A0A7T0G4E8_9BACT|nr:MAG: type II secretion system protein [Candidatus Nitrohelix vancouverensis]